MAIDKVIVTQSTPRVQRSVDRLSSANTVRVFRLSPSDVMLQLRMNQTYATVALLAPELDELIVALMTARAELEQV